eukprot:m.31085 g.31085  ORF g.31085 m.31085 type:complete len:216 (-) comp13944_c0_seq3:412-1059(-)
MEIHSQRHGNTCRRLSPVELHEISDMQRPLTTTHRRYAEDFCQPCARFHWEFNLIAAGYTPKISQYLVTHRSYSSPDTLHSLNQSQHVPVEVFRSHMNPITPCTRGGVRVVIGFLQDPDMNPRKFYLVMSMFMSNMKEKNNEKGHLRRFHSCSCFDDIDCAIDVHLHHQVHPGARMYNNPCKMENPINPFQRILDTFLLQYVAFNTRYTCCCIII